jgi:hypothetical protein
MAEMQAAPQHSEPFDMGYETADEPDPAFGETDDDGIETPDEGEPHAEI